MTAGIPREPVVLTGSRIVLSIPGADDVDRITEVCQDAAIAQWTTVPSPYSRADAEGFVFGMVNTGWAHGTTCTWAIRLESNGPVVGMVGLHDISDGQAELGYWLAPDARGLGVMSEAVSLVIDYAFAPSAAGNEAGLGLKRLVWHAFVGNAASAAVARRAGFQFEGEHRLGGVLRGRRLDNWQAALLHDDPRTPAAGWPETS